MLNDEQEEYIPPSSDKKKKESEEPSKWVFFDLSVWLLSYRLIKFLEVAEKEKAGPGESIATKNKHPKPPMAENRHLRWL